MRGFENKSSGLNCNFVIYFADEQRLRLIGQMQEARKKTVGGQVENTNAEKRLGQNEPIVSVPKSTAEAIAREVGVSD